MGWMPKHVVLQNKILRYYNIKSKQDQVFPLNSDNYTDFFGDNPDGFFNFDSYQTKVKLEGREITLSITGSVRTFTFRARTEAESKAWYREIKKHINKSKGKPTAIP